MEQNIKTSLIGCCRVISTGFPRAVKKCHTCHMCRGEMEQTLRRNPSFIYRRETILLKQTFCTSALSFKYPAQRDFSETAVNICTKIAAPSYLSDCGLVCDSGGDPLFLLTSRNQHSHSHAVILIPEPPLDSYFHVFNQHTHTHSAVTGNNNLPLGKVPL